MASRKPDTRHPSRPSYERLVVGLSMLLLGTGDELLSRPLQPITYVPGLAFFPFGLGVAIALVEWKWKLPGLVLFLAAMWWLAHAIQAAGTSLLPLGLLLGAYGATSFGLYFYRE